MDLIVISFFLNVLSFQLEDSLLNSKGIKYQKIQWKII